MQDLDIILSIGTSVVFGIKGKPVLFSENNTTFKCYKCTLQGRPDQQLDPFLC